jgi:DNA polymerase-3 subunit epsilon
MTDEHPSRTLNERVLERLRGGPMSATAICAEILGIADAPPAVAARLAVALFGADPRVTQVADGRWALAAPTAHSPGLDDCPFAVVDCETTGMRASADDRITEIAVVLVQGARREVILDTLVNPERPIPPAIAAVTGITDAMVREAPTFADVADQVAAALAGRVFVAHNARFDWGFVSASLGRTRGTSLVGPRLCTVRLARRLVPEAGSCGLDNLSRWFGFENEARHRAAGDAAVTGMLLQRLLFLVGARQVRTLDELLRFTTLSRRELRLHAAQENA